MNKYKIESLAVHKRTFIVEAEDDFAAIAEVYKAVEDGKMKNGDPLPEEVFDKRVPPEVWPVWGFSTNTTTTDITTLSSTSLSGSI